MTVETGVAPATGGVTPAMSEAEMVVLFTVTLTACAAVHPLAFAMVIVPL